MDETRGERREAKQRKKREMRKVGLSSVRLIVHTVKLAADRLKKGKADR